MQWQIVENAINSTFPQIGDQFLPQLEIWQKHIEHMIRLFAVHGDVRQLYIMCICPILQTRVIHFPDLFAVQLDFLALFELSK